MDHNLHSKNSETLSPAITFDTLPVVCCTHTQMVWPSEHFRWWNLLFVYQTLLCWCTVQLTLLEHGYSPAQLLFACCLGTTVSITQEKCQPCLPKLERLVENETHLKSCQKENFDSRHHAWELPPLTTGSTVFARPARSTSCFITTSMVMHCLHSQWGVPEQLTPC